MTQPGYAPVHPNEEDRRDARYRTVPGDLGSAPPWTVANVELDVKGQQVVVQVDPGPGPFACPECGTAAPRYDSKPRRWRHLDTCQFTTWIAAQRKQFTPVQKYLPPYAVTYAPDPTARAG